MDYKALQTWFQTKRSHLRRQEPRPKPLNLSQTVPTSSQISLLSTTTTTTTSTSTSSPSPSLHPHDTPSPQQTTTPQQQQHQQQPHRPARIKPRPDQTQYLVTAFSRDRKPDRRERERMAVEVGLPVTFVTLWFQNRRSKVVRERNAAKSLEGGDGADAGFKVDGAVKGLEEVGGRLGGEVGEGGEDGEAMEVLEAAELLLKLF
ncbi:hypothetical protein HDU79_006100 [Rhizoclosmatium sp. JEL0117]|nr:hypothetical protein HDU79_006100 [Rhizoclosmatium sp. JEL0117]